MKEAKFQRIIIKLMKRHSLTVAQVSEIVDVSIPTVDKMACWREFSTSINVETRD